MGNENSPIMITFWNKYCDRLGLLRLLLLHGANPLDIEEELEDEEEIAIVQEVKLFKDNPIRYRSDCSALIQLAFGLASLDLPVLVVALIAEHLVSINEEKFFGEYSEKKSWEI